jgi:hypothetical protein
VTAGHRREPFGFAERGGQVGAGVVELGAQCRGLGF